MKGITKILLIISFIALSIIIVEAYINSPSICLWINPEDHILISNVTYPDQIYRSQSLPITVTIQNIGPDSKDALIQLVSKDDPMMTSNVWLAGANTKVNTTFWLPVKSEGEAGFTIDVFWAGPWGICMLPQNSTDGSFLALAADYEATSSPEFASRAQDFTWALSITNVGNTAANLTVQIVKKDPLIITSPDTVQVPNLQVGQSASAVFDFIVPSSANLGNCTITVNLTTTYPDSALYQGTQETTSRSFNVTIQESPIQAAIENAEYYIYALVGLFVAVGILFSVFNKRRETL